MRILAFMGHALKDVRYKNRLCNLAALIRDSNNIFSVILEYSREWVEN